MAGPSDMSPEQTPVSRTEPPAAPRPSSPPSVSPTKSGELGTAALLLGLLSPILSIGMLLVYANLGGSASHGASPAVILAVSLPTVLTLWLAQKASAATKPGQRAGVTRGTIGSIISVASTLGLLALASALFHHSSCGRPVRVRGRRKVPEMRLGRAWGQAAAGSSATDPEWSLLQTQAAQLDPGLREWLAEVWLRDAAEEHASVAAFARLSLDLLAAGAPPELLRLAHEAALDEVRHAEQCCRLASLYAGQPCAPSAFLAHETRTPAPCPRPELLARLAAESLVDGCMSEGFAAAAAERARQGAGSRSVRSLLDGIAQDEQRHADLGWEILRWCVEEGGEPVRRRMERELSRLPLQIRVRDLTPQGLHDELVHHGRLPAEQQQSVYQTVRGQVVEAAQAVLDSAAVSTGEARTAAHRHRRP